MHGVLGGGAIQQAGGLLDQRGGVVVFNEQMKAQAAESGRMRMELGEATEKGLFELHYQPIVGLRHGDVYGVEALLRWNRSRRNRLAAGEFIDLARDAGLMARLDRTAIGMACDQRIDWLSQGLSRFRVSVNVSGAQLADPKFPDDVEKLLKARGLPPRMLEIESGEAAFLDSLQADEGILRALDDIGIGLVMDDFDLGEGSMRALARLPIRVVKLDRAYLAQVQADARGRRSVRAFVRFASELEILTAAEGVENRETVDWLKELGVDLAQGYYFARPMAPQALTPMLDSGDFSNENKKSPAQALHALARSLAGRGKAHGSAIPPESVGDSSSGVSVSKD